MLGMPKIHGLRQLILGRCPSAPNKFGRLHAPFGEGTVQTIFRLTTTQGQFIFKYYENRTVESVRFEAEVVNYIQSKNFSCAALFKNKQGQSVGVHDDKPYMLFEFVDSQVLPELNAEQRRQIAHTAAQLQNITRRYKPKWRKFRWNYSPALCLQLAQDRAHELSTSNAQAKQVWFERTLNQLNLPNNLSKGICHCDYHLSNILFKDGELVALLDFDDANYTYLSFDLVNLIDGWAWPHEGDFHPEMAHQIRQDYEQIRPLNTLEKRHLFDVHKLGILFDGIWFFKRGQAEDFYERQKIEFLDSLGRIAYKEALFGK